MTREFRSAWVALIVIVGVAAVFALLRTSTELQPELLRALVATEVASSGVARLGHREIPAGTPFQLHAVVEARDWRGRPVFYTDATALELPDGPVDGESLRPWNRLEKVRVLWFTVEGSPPYGEVSTAEDLERFKYRDIFQADWPQTWSVPGSLTPAIENFLPDLASRRVSARFGTQRFHVRVEIYPSDEAMVPSGRFRSPGAEDVVIHPERVTSVSATLAWPLGPLSRVFGLPQIEPGRDVEETISAELKARSSSGLSFSRLQLLRWWLAEIGSRWEDLEWRSIEINGETRWYQGSPVRAGSKVAFLLEDRGVAGWLDSDDLCLDFDQGATVRTLREIFVGEGLIELAPVSRRESGS